MKKLFKNTNLSKLFALALSLSFCSQAFAASAIAVVSSLTGRAFVHVDGRTKSLAKGDQVPAFSEVFTEVGAQLTLSDYFDHKYHLAGSGHIQFLNKAIELKEGYMWVQSFNDSHTFTIQTANAHAAFKRGEGIVSFDSFSGRSQLLVKKGEWNYSNSMNQYLSQTVGEGQFSFVVTDQDEGAPRAPTPIGYHSFKQIVALFKHVTPSEHTTPGSYEAPSREIASVEDEAALVPMNPSATTPKVHPTVNPAMESELMQLYAPKLVKKAPAQKKWTPSYQKKSGATVRIFGSPKVKHRTPASHTAPKAETSSRTPASIGGMAPEIKGDAFESKLMQEYKSQMRHSSETNKLINELKSFDQDYVQGY